MQALTKQIAGLTKQKMLLEKENKKLEGQQQVRSDPSLSFSISAMPCVHMKHGNGPVGAVKAATASRSIFNQLGRGQNMEIIFPVVSIS